ncbi:MAG: hypothetical protein WCV71_04215 [Patescibacteria group bacterium]|jgi:hypothetical protein
MRSKNIYSLLLALVLFTIISVQPAMAGDNAFGLELRSDIPIVFFADYYLSDSWMIHPWFVTGEQSNVLIRYATSVPGFDKFEVGAGPTWSTVDGAEKIRFVSGELDFALPLGRGLVWQSYNLGQWSTDQSSDSGLLRQQIKLGKSRLGVFNETRLSETSSRQIFLGMYYNCAPLKHLSTCKIVLTVNVDRPDEWFTAWIAEF